MTIYDPGASTQFLWKYLTKEDGSSDKTEKLEAPCHSGCDSIKKGILRALIGNRPSCPHEWECLDGTLNNRQSSVPYSMDTSCGVLFLRKEGVMTLVLYLVFDFCYHI